MNRDAPHIDNPKSKECEQRKRFAKALLFAGFFFMFSGVALSFALFFVPNEYTASITTVTLVLYMLFLIDVPFYNHISKGFEENENSDTDT